MYKIQYQVSGKSQQSFAPQTNFIYYILEQTSRDYFVTVTIVVELIYHISFCSTSVCWRLCFIFWIFCLCDHAETLDLYYKIKMFCYFFLSFQSNFFFLFNGNVIWLWVEFKVLLFYFFSQHGNNFKVLILYFLWTTFGLDFCKRASTSWICYVKLAPEG